MMTMLMVAARSGRGEVEDCLSECMCERRKERESKRDRKKQGEIKAKHDGGFP